MRTLIHGAPVHVYVSAGEGLRLAGSVLVSMLGMWFMSIGTGFWLWGDHGLLGTAHGDIDMAGQSQPL